MNRTNKKLTIILIILIIILFVLSLAMFRLNTKVNNNANESNPTESDANQPNINANEDAAAHREPATDSNASPEPDVPDSSTASEEPATTEDDSQTFTINMNFVGDIMLAGNETGTSRIDDYAENEAESYFFEGVRDIFLNDDITIANCENVFTDNEELPMSEKGQTEAKAEYEKKLEEYNNAKHDAEEKGIEFEEDEPIYDFRAFWFRCKSDNAKLMTANGVDVVSLDNNHTHDFGIEGFEDTKAAMDNARLDWGRAGKIVYKEKNGFTIAFVIGSMYYAGDDYSMIDDLEEAKQHSDYQVVFFHGGEERLHSPEQWKIDSCRSFVDQGADLVVGCHPHVLQPMESYKGVNIVYSLGNFIFGGNNYPENVTAIYNHVLTLTEDKATGKLSITDENNTIIPCFVYTGEINNFQPAIIDDYEDEKQIILDFMDWKRETPY